MLYALVSIEVLAGDYTARRTFVKATERHFKRLGRTWSFLGKFPGAVDEMDVHESVEQLVTRAAADSGLHVRVRMSVSSDSPHEFRVPARSPRRQQSSHTKV